MSNHFNDDFVTKRVMGIKLFKKKGLEHLQQLAKKEHLKLFFLFQKVTF